MIGNRSDEWRRKMVELRGVEPLSLIHYVRTFTCFPGFDSPGQARNWCPGNATDSVAKLPSVPTARTCWCRSLPLAGVEERTGGVKPQRPRHSRTEREPHQPQQPRGPYQGYCLVFLPPFITQPRRHLRHVALDFGIKSKPAQPHKFKERVVNHRAGLGPAPWLKYRATEAIRPPRTLNQHIGYSDHQRLKSGRRFYPATEGQSRRLRIHQLAIFNGAALRSAERIRLRTSALVICYCSPKLVAGVGFAPTTFRLWA